MSDHPPNSIRMRSKGLFLFIALSCSAHAQLAEWADQRSEEILFQEALAIGGGRWAVIGKSAFAGAYLISVRNGDGSIAWEDGSQFFVGDDLGQVILLPDSGLLHIGASDGCDYVAPPSRLRRYTADGTLVWERMYEAEDAPRFTHAANGASTLLAVGGEDTLQILDPAGEVVSGFVPSYSGMSHMYWQGDSALYVTAGTSILRVDLNGNILNSATIGSFTHDLHYDGAQVFVLAGNGVHRFGAALAQQSTESLPSLDHHSSFVDGGNDLFVNTTAGLHSLDTAGNVALLFSWPELPDLTHAGCAVRNDRVLSLGNTRITGRTTGLMRMLSNNGDPVPYDADVEVILQVDSVWTEYTIDPIWNRKARITGRVVNHGTTVLDDVVVHLYTEVPYIMCTLPGHRVVATELGLQPGDTASLPFGDVAISIWLTVGQAAGEDEICIVALAPNNLADRNTDDNTSCVTVEFVLDVAAPFSGPPFTLAPNPTTDLLHLTGPPILKEELRIRILDPTGRIVQDQVTASGTNTLTIDVSRLSPATYVLMVEGTDFRAMAPLLIVRP